MNSTTDRVGEQGRVTRLLPRPRHLRKVAAHVGTPLVVPGTDVIFRQGEAADGVWYVEAGVVKVVAFTSQGDKRAVTALAGPGDFFGAAHLARRNATATALVDAAVVNIPKSRLQALLDGDPAFARQFSAYLMRRVARLEEDRIDVVFRRAERRLARALLLLAAVDDRNHQRPALDAVDEETLAEIVDMMQPHLARLLAEFGRLGFISTRGPLKVRSSLATVLLQT